MVRRLLVCLVLLSFTLPVRADGVQAVGRKPIPAKIGQMMGTIPPKNGLWRTWVPASQIMVGPNQYNWDRIDAKLAAAEAVGTKVILQVLFYTSDIKDNSYFIDWTPPWFYQAYGNLLGKPWPSMKMGDGVTRQTGYVLTSGGATACILPYDNAAWREMTFALAAALAARYDNHPAVVAVIVPVGIDGETHWIKDAVYNWQAAARQVPGLEYRFGQYVYQAMDAYAARFIYTRVYLDNAPGGNARMERADYAASKGLSIKHSGMLPDVDSAKGYGKQVGSWDAMAAYAGQGIAWESAYGLGGVDTRTYGLYAGLTFYPAFVIVHPEWVTQTTPEFRAWAEAHMGSKVSELPSVWTVFRDMEYPKIMWSGTEGVSGWPGNFGQGMTVTGVTVLQRPHVPGNNTAWQARWAGHVTRAQANVASDFVYPAYSVRITAQTYGSSHLSLVWGANSRTVPLAEGPRNEWVTYEFDLPGFGGSLTMEGDAYVHMVEIVGNGAAPTATQTATRTLTMTPTRTIQATPYPTYTAMPTYTPAPTYTVQPTYTPYPTHTPPPTLTWDELWDEINRRMDELGIPGQPVIVGDPYEWGR